MLPATTSVCWKPASASAPNGACSWPGMAQLPPCAAAPTRPALAATRAPVASATARTNCWPAASAPVLQLQNTRSRSRSPAPSKRLRKSCAVTARPPRWIAPGAPWATRCTACRPGSASAAISCATASSPGCTSHACTPGLSPASRTSRSAMPASAINTSRTAPSGSMPLIAVVWVACSWLLVFTVGSLKNVGDRRERAITATSPGRGQAH